MATQTLSKKIGQFGGEADENGNVSSDVSKNFNLFGLKTGMGDLLGRDTLQYIADKLPLIEYDPNYGNGNFLKFDSPNLSVPGYGTYDLKAYMGFDMDLGVNVRFSYDFGAINASTTVTAPRTDDVLVRNAYSLDTSTTSISANVTASPGTKPFSLGLYLGSAEPAEDGAPTPGFIKAGLFDAGVYKNGKEKYTFDLGVDKSNIYEELIGTGNLFPGQNKTFGTKSLYGEIGVPQLPSLNLKLDGVGANAIYGAGQAVGTGPDFASIHIHPLDYVPVIGQLNQNNFNFITSPLVDAGISYKIFDLDLSLSAALRQTLDVSVKSVTVKATAEQATSEDKPGDMGADPDGDGYYIVDTKEGKLGDILTFGNFSMGEREETRIVETYSVTLHFKQDVDIVLSGGVDFTFLEASLFINPILIDELRLNIGPLFKTDFALEIASIDIDELFPNNEFDVTFTLAPVIHTIHTSIDVVGTAGNDANLKLVEGSDAGNSQLAVDGLAGNDGIQGNRYANTLDGGDGDDFIQGGNQYSTTTDADLIRGGQGWDSLYGGTGNDTLDLGTGGPGNGFETAAGGTGDDTIYVAAVKANIRGDAGNDRIYAKLAPLGGQTFDGGNGVDTLILDARDAITKFTINFVKESGTIIAASQITSATTYAGIDRIEFNSGVANDTLSGSNQGDLLSGGGGDDALHGQFGDDQVFGDDGRDDVRGDEGNDSLYGGADDDFLNGDSGNDKVYGDAGNDIVGYYINSAGVLTFGMNESGDDTIVGGDGNDLIRDVSGNNTLQGGNGDDRILGGGNYTTLSGGAGNDELTSDLGVTVAFGGDGADLIYADDGGVLGSGGTIETKLQAIGGLGSDSIRTLGTGRAVEIFGDLNGGAGAAGDIDTLIVLDFSSSQPLSGAFSYAPPIPFSGVVSPLSADGRLANGTIWRGIEAFFIRGDEGVQNLVAGNAADTLDGGFGNDYLDGRRGLDTLIGNAGDDILVGNLGDLFDGGDGFDTLALDATLVDSTVVSGLAPPGTLPSPNLGIAINLGLVTQRLEPFTPGANTGPYTLITERIGNASFGTQIKDIERLYMTAGGTRNDTITGAENDDRLLGGAGDDTLYGLAGHDTIFGGLGEDHIFGGDGNDTIDDSEAANNPNGPVATVSGDRIFAGAGDDTIIASANANFIAGDSGNDQITVLNSPGTNIVRVGVVQLNQIDGGQGNDTITASDASERIMGGLETVDERPPAFDGADGGFNPGLTPAEYDGADLIYARGGDDVVTGGNGGDTIFGGDGDDRIKGGSGGDILAGDAGYDILDGGGGNDTISGGLNDEDVGDELYGRIGNDRLNGSNGADILDGGDGDDTITSGGLNSVDYSYDDIRGGAGNDVITATNDALIDGGSGDDTITLGDGRQEVLVSTLNGALAGIDRVDGFLPGEDVIHFDGPNLSFDRLSIIAVRGGATRISFTGMDNAPVVILRGVTPQDLGAGAIVITGPARPQSDLVVLSSNSLFSIPSPVLLANDLGNDPVLSAVSGASGVSATLFSGRVVVGTGAVGGSFNYTASNSRGSGDAEVTVDVVTTSDGSDNIELDNYIDFAGSWIDLLGGDDEFGGSAMVDHVTGGEGVDRIAGYGAADELSGGAGNDLIDGGDGADKLFGNEGNDELTGIAGADTLTGGVGNDTYVIGSHTIQTVVELANEGMDLIISNSSLVLANNVENGRITGRAPSLTGNALANNLRGNDFANTIEGLAGNDKLLGDNGDDTLFGGDGADTLIGGLGLDTLRGGAGADRFTYATIAEGGDAIRDFSSGAGDRIDVSDIDANTLLTGNQGFRFVGTAAFTAAGDLRITTSPRLPSVWIVQGDVDGDLVADFSLNVTTSTALTARDFVL